MDMTVFQSFRTPCVRNTHTSRRFDCRPATGATDKSGHFPFTDCISVRFFYIDLERCFSFQTHTENCIHYRECEIG